MNCEESVVETIITTFLSKFTESIPLETYAELLQAFFEISRNHLNVIMTSVCDCWQALARDSKTFSAMLEHLLELSASSHQTEKKDGGRIDAAVVLPLASTSALIEGAENEEILRRFFPELYTTLLLQCGRLVGSVFVNSAEVSSEYFLQNKPISVVVHALRTLLIRCHLDDAAALTDTLNFRRDIEDTLHYYDSVSDLSKVVTNSGAYLDSIKDILYERRLSTESTCRVVVMAVFSAFVKCCQTRTLSFAEDVIGSLLSGLTDKVLVVRKVAVRGIANIAHCEDPLFNQHSTTALLAMKSGLDDSADHKGSFTINEIAFEAMQGLSRLAARCSIDQLQPLLISIILRIRPCFEKDSAALRSVAFTLFGNLIRFGSESDFEDQVHSSLVPMLLHLGEDSDEDGRKMEFLYFPPKEISGYWPHLNIGLGKEFLKQCLICFTNPKDYMVFR
ncbi:unnamed protein product [Soboliphyme baturini]|uniref:HEAT repeat-containing protein 1 n=1 Tax=Soboliphyme baturini TaxID=241478 RepID=A0A183II61_9BILA|nr:unnamed protein product [Soboliphyme baturini]